MLFVFTGFGDKNKAISIIFDWNNLTAENIMPP